MGICLFWDDRSRLDRERNQISGDLVYVFPKFGTSFFKRKSWEISAVASFSRLVPTLRALFLEKNRWYRKEILIKEAGGVGATSSFLFEPLEPRDKITNFKRKSLFGKPRVCTKKLDPHSGGNAAKNCIFPFLCPTFKAAWHLRNSAAFSYHFPFPSLFLRETGEK